MESGYETQCVIELRAAGNSAGPFFHIHAPAVPFESLAADLCSIVPCGGHKSPPGQGHMLKKRLPSPPLCPSPHQSTINPHSHKGKAKERRDKRTRASVREQRPSAASHSWVREGPSMQAGGGSRERESP
ncbi:hypothetical protein P4O66_004964 [Electrophorus voltai]|uniref:Uncharacterized protein n=1 Tax=Electrophorus voltai TaxID=2609070 RepID=A0AAD8ZW76_9TELE|nr:hypothetical protein P4O66_004964 [Electrophorus voltai]